MRHFSWISVLALLMTLFCLPGLAEGSSLGEPMADFTVETSDGGVFTLSESLKDRDVVLINLWASWCGPCMEEFPLLEAAYEEYSDRVAVVALSVEPQDTTGIIAECAKEFGLTFPMGSDSTVGLADAFGVTGIPTSIVVDRFGRAAFLKTGAMGSSDEFARVFDFFLDEGYSETRVLRAVPPAKPDVQGASEAALAEAAGVEGEKLTFQNGGDTEWPMLPGMVDGRSVLASSNAGIDGSTSCVYIHVTAGEGNALAFEARVSSEKASDALFASVDGKRMLFLTGERDWATLALALEPGEHEIGLGYAKDDNTAGGEDSVWLDNVRLVSGEEAASLLAAMPPRPVAAALTLGFNGREVAIEGPQEVVKVWFGERFWIIPEGDAELDIVLPEGIQPELSICVSYYDWTSFCLSDCVKADGSGYALSTPIDRGSATYAGEGMTNLILYQFRDVGQCDELSIMLFASEDTLRKALAEASNSENCALNWHYVDLEAGQVEQTP